MCARRLFNVPILNHGDFQSWPRNDHPHFLTPATHELWHRALPIFRFRARRIIFDPVLALAQRSANRKYRRLAD
jgi:hypothetical protein